MATAGINPHSTPSLPTQPGISQPVWTGREEGPRAPDAGATAPVAVAVASAAAAAAAPSQGDDPEKVAALINRLSRPWYSRREARASDGLQSLYAQLRGKGYLADQIVEFEKAGLSGCVKVLLNEPLFKTLPLHVPDSSGGYTTEILAPYQAFKRAGQLGNQELLLFLVRRFGQGVLPCDYNFAFEEAARNGHIEMCEWMVESGMPISSFALTAAIRGGINGGDSAQATRYMNLADLSKIGEDNRRQLADCAALQRKGALLVRILEAGPTEVSDSAFIYLAERRDHAELALLLTKGKPVSDALRQKAIMALINSNFIPANEVRNRPSDDVLKERAIATFRVLAREGAPSASLLTGSWTSNALLTTVSPRPEHQALFAELLPIARLERADHIRAMRNMIGQRNIEGFKQLHRSIWLSDEERTELTGTCDFYLKDNFWGVEMRTAATEIRKLLNPMRAI